MKTFEEILEKSKNEESIKPTLVVACADDLHVLEAVNKAYLEKMINVILVGDQIKIENICKDNNIDFKDFKILNSLDKKEACDLAVKTLKSEGDILMKGLVDSSIILKSVLNKESGIKPHGNILSHVGLVELDTYDKFLFITDGAMNIAPNLEEKIEIIKNAVYLAEKLNISNPKVAVLAAKEKVDDKMPITKIAQRLEELNSLDEIKDCIIQGPLALDNAISKESVIIKGITGPVAGDADILLVPEIESGNILYKSLIYFSKAKAAGIILGADYPIVLTSRADSFENKFLSIALSTIL
ncbi:phosphate acyltransferase [Cetobacterium ceti]